MSTSHSKKLEAKIEAKLKEITKRSENRRCMDCLEKGPRYVVMNFNIFVCSACSGVHREFQHRALGISMSKFTWEQVNDLETGGNKAAKKLWMARWSPKDYPEPDGNDIPKIREFIRKKYVEKVWYKKKKSKKSKNKDVDNGDADDDWGSNDNNNNNNFNDNFTDNNDDFEEDSKEKRRARRKAEKKALKEARRKSKSGNSDDLSAGLDNFTFEENDVKQKKSKSIN